MLQLENRFLLENSFPWKTVFQLYHRQGTPIRSEKRANIIGERFSTVGKPFSTEVNDIVGKPFSSVGKLFSIGKQFSMENRFPIIFARFSERIVVPSLCYSWKTVFYWKTVFHGKRYSSYTTGKGPLYALRNERILLENGFPQLENCFPQK